MSGGVGHRPALGQGVGWRCVSALVALLGACTTGDEPIAVAPPGSGGMQTPESDAAANASLNASDSALFVGRGFGLTPNRFVTVCSISARTSPALVTSPSALMRLVAQAAQ